MIRKRFLAGLFSLLPLGITVWLLKAIFQILIGFFRTPLQWAASLIGLGELAYWQEAFFSILAMLCLLLAVGALVQHFIGRRLLGWVDSLMLNIPGAKSIYGATKQLMGAIQSGKGGSFKEVVLFAWPSPTSRMIGFVSNRSCPWAEKEGSKLVTVFVPTSPLPTSGYVVMVDESNVWPLDITPEQALTWVVSGGAVTPTEIGQLPPGAVTQKTYSV